MEKSVSIKAALGILVSLLIIVNAVYHRLVDGSAGLALSLLTIVATLYLIIILMDIIEEKFYEFR